MFFLNEIDYLHALQLVRVSVKDLVLTLSSTSMGSEVSVVVYLMPQHVNVVRGSVVLE